MRDEPWTAACLGRGMRCVLSIMVLAALVAGCGGGGGGGGFSATAAAAVVTSSTATAAAVVTSGPGAASALRSGEREALARALAPQYRYNAYVAGSSSVQNKNEDFFPIGVATFLADLAAGRPRVVVQRSRQGVACVSEVRSFTGTMVFGQSNLSTFPADMAGDAPGDAPSYIHVYDDPARRTLYTDGSVERVVALEYWYFYAQDRAEAVIFGRIPTSGSTDFAGHRGDWEHSAYVADVRMDANGAILSARITEGAFYGHGRPFTATRSEMVFVDEHPVIFVSQGKHAGYPQAGEWHDAHFDPALADFTDFFRGNGVWVDAWRAPLLDLAAPALAPGEFMSREFLDAAARGPLTLPDWTAYRGRWGPDRNQLPTLGGLITLGASPTGPKAKRAYGDFAGRGTFTRWSDLKAQNGRLRVYADTGVTIPRANPVPLPVRR